MKRKSPIIPQGDFEKVQAEAEERSFFENPLIPWWSKVVHILHPTHKQTRTPTWCKYCGRKHSRKEPCEALRKVVDLTATRLDGNEKPVPRGKRVGEYTTRPEEL